MDRGRLVGLEVCCGHEAAVRDLVPLQWQRRSAHAATSQDLAISMGAFLRDTTFPAVQALNQPGATTLLPAMPQVVNPERHGLVVPKAALYGIWNSPAPPPAGHCCADSGMHDTGWWWLGHEHV